MKMNIQMYPKEHQISLLNGLKDKYTFGRIRFYESFNFKNNILTLFNEQLIINQQLRKRIGHEKIIVSSFKIREGVSNDWVLEVTGFYDQVKKKTKQNKPKSILKKGRMARMV